ncbi:tRNA pseudouridine(55) synthase TruB [Gammaproteobacteria bacterium]|nr:tRNA pseudouridine(55) synthase TruB [Gammaproteobacteria bacterium]MDC3313148.1 tRNA pseudouridine(55) synthase TruB [Gammaproteobacteria bacterium]|tara:strand:- start:171 stop:1010 length:840 start_codon:yes stop_codon:yes gene_type:complete
MDGFLLLDKEKGISSNQLVQKVKKSLSLKKVGHLGTLDPMATGLMILAINRATKFSSYFLESDKSYDASIQLGSSTDTDDAMGNIISSSDIIPIEKDIKKSLASFIGQSMQTAPFFSALKHKGKPLYKYAREGEFISKPPREINIFSIENIICEHNKCSFIVHCSKGTYIRSIARDLGDKLNSGGHLSALRRLSQGIFNIKNAMTIENIELNKLITIEEAFSELSEIQLDSNQTKFFMNGVKIEEINLEDDTYKIYDSSKKFLGLGMVSNSVLALKRLV